METLEERAEKIKMGLQLLAPVQKTTHEMISKVADKLDIYPCDLDLVFHSDMLEYSIAVASCMGVEVDLDGFFETIKEAAKHKTEWLKAKHPNI